MTHPLEETYRWFTKAVPNPTATNIRVQLGVHLEEVEEMLRELHTNDHTTMVLLESTRKNLNDLSKRLTLRGQTGENTGMDLIYTRRKD